MNLEDQPLVRCPSSVVRGPSSVVQGLWPVVTCPLSGVLRRLSKGKTNH